MKFEIVKLKNLSGPKATFYSILLENEKETLFDKFFNENKQDFRPELRTILGTIDQIANENGARRTYFKENEGKLGDLVCAMYDSPDSNLRLYCIRFGTTVIVLGGGGFKSKKIRALQEDPKLLEENNLVRKISEIIYQKMKEEEIFWVNEFILGGNLKIDTNE
jgi:hypothetical protein